MKRYLDDLVLNDLATKMVVLTGPRQVGKTTLARQLMSSFVSAQYLNWDVLQDRLVQMIECKWGDSKPHRGLMRFAEQFADAEAEQVVYGLRQEEFRNGIKITDAANWLMGLAA